MEKYVTPKAEILTFDMDEELLGDVGIGSSGVAQGEDPYVEDDGFDILK